MRLNVLLLVSFAFAALVDLLAPVALAVFFARRYQGRWRYWLYGVLVFLLFQVATRIPVMVYIQQLPRVVEALKEPLWFWSFLVVAAFTAGLFEEGGRWLAFRWAIPPAERRWGTALMLGAGHGGLESIGVGLLALASMVGYLTVTSMSGSAVGDKAAQLEAAREQYANLQGWEPLMGGWERLGALAIQVAMAVMVQQAFVRGRRWWWYALGAHTLVDFSTVGLLRIASDAWGFQTGIILTEILVAVYALIGVWLIAALQPLDKDLADAALVEPAKFDGQAQELPTSQTDPQGLHGPA